MTQDIIRRILVDYFGYDVHFVMNITDIDDKVREHNAPQNPYIERSRSLTDLEKITFWLIFVARTQVLTQELLSEVRSAWDSFLLTDLVDKLPIEDQPSGEDPSSYWKKILGKSKDAVWKSEILRKKEDL